MAILDSYTAFVQKLTRTARTWSNSLNPGPGNYLMTDGLDITAAENQELVKELWESTRVDADAGATSGLDISNDTTNNRRKIAINDAYVRSRFTGGTDISVDANGRIDFTGTTGTFTISDFQMSKQSPSKSFINYVAGDSFDGAWTMTVRLNNLDASDLTAPHYSLFLNNRNVQNGSLTRTEQSQNVSINATGLGLAMAGEHYTFEVRVVHGTDRDEAHLTRVIPGAPQQAGNMFYGTFSSQNPTKSQVQAASSVAIGPTNTITISSATNQYIGFYQPPGNDITSIIASGVEQIGAYRKLDNPFNDNSFEAWITNRALTFTGSETIRVVRG